MLKSPENLGIIHFIGIGGIGMSGIAEIWILSNMGIIGSFIGFNQLAKRGSKENEFTK